METDYESSNFAILFAIIAFAIMYLLNFTRNKYRFFELRGIRNPKPIFLLGNIHQILNNHLAILSRQWTAEYGKILGIFVGWAPRFVIADAETLNRICIKDFDAFSDHMGFGLMEKHQEKFIFFQNGDRWRKIRALMSPTFTSGKVRRMYTVLDACADDLVSLSSEQMEDSVDKMSAIVNVKNLFSLYTMDAIASCCYGMKMDRARGANSLSAVAIRNEFVRLCLPILTISTIRLIVSIIGPRWLLKLVNFTAFSSVKIGELMNVVSGILETRRTASQNRKYNDYLQMLIDSRLDDEIELDHVDEAENHHASLSHESLKADQQQLVDRVIQNQSGNTLKAHDMKLTDTEILSNAMFLMVVGIESTHNLLTACVYALSHHKEIQERLYQTVKSIAEIREDGHTFGFDYERLTTNEYLDAVISESLRVMPILYTVDRRANRNYHLENWNLNIPKDAILFIGIYAIHHDPDYWSEPDKFDPQRFIGENRDRIVHGSYCPFGIGPRHCVGMRFSLTETKLAIAKLIMKYRFEPVPGLIYPGKLSSTFETLSLDDPRVVLTFRST